MLAAAGIAAAQSSPIAASEPATPLAQLTTFASLSQLFANRVAQPDIPPALPAGFISPLSEPAAIEALQLHLAWTGLTGLSTSGTWDDGTTAAVKRFQWKYKLKATGISDDTTTETLRTVARDGQLDPQCLTPGIVICVDKTQKVTRYVKDGQTIKVMDSNYGPEKGNPHFPEWSSTREGVFKIFFKNKNAVSSLYGFTMPDYMAFDGGEGFHFSGWFRESGYKDVTQGCIVTNDRAASRWLYDNTPKNTKVVVYH
ncbi:MAG: L,D-transpeptidase family protein [Actinomycetes bacterium]